MHIFPKISLLPALVLTMHICTKISLLPALVLTMHIFPKISLLPALVAGFILVLIRHKPGTVKMPFFFTSAVAISAKLFITLVATDFFSSHFVARASAMAPLDMATTAFFMGAMAGMGCR